MSDMKISYPYVSKRRLFMFRFRQVLTLVLILAAVICPIVNYLTKGPMWSLVAIWGMIIVWRTFLAPDVLEFSALSFAFRLSAYILILITLIGILLSPGWLGFVLPIIGFSSLIISAILYIINVSKHKTDAMPLIVEILAALIAFFAVYFATGILNWPMIVLGSMASIFLLVGIVAFHRSLWNELKKRLHTT